MTMENEQSDDLIDDQKLKIFGEQAALKRSVYQNEANANKVKKEGLKEGLMKDGKMSKEEAEHLIAQEKEAMIAAINAEQQTTTSSLVT